MQRVKSRAPPNFMPQVLDTEKRLNLLFDALNTMDANVVEELNGLAIAIRARDFDRVTAIHGAMVVQVDGKEKWLVCFAFSLFRRTRLTNRVGRHQTSHYYEQGNASLLMVVVRCESALTYQTEVYYQRIDYRLTCDISTTASLWYPHTIQLWSWLRCVTLMKYILTRPDLQPVNRLISDHRSIVH